MRRSEVFLASTSVLAALVSAVFVLVASRRGIDIADQSLYLTMVDQPTKSLRSASGYHTLLNPLFELVGESVPRWRLMRAAVDISADVLFGIALVGWVRNRHPGGALDRPWPKVALIAGVTTVGFTSWAWTPNGFGYNELGTALATILMALLLVMLTDSGHRTTMRRSAVAFGALLFAMIIVKWSAALAIIASTAVVLVAQYRLRRALKLMGAALIGFAAMALTVHLAVVNLGDLAGGILDGTSDVARGKHSLGRLSRSYLSSVRFGLENVYQFGLPVLLGLAMMWAMRKRSGEAGPPSLPTVGVVAGVAGGLLFFTGMLDLGWNLLTLHHWAAAMTGTVLALLFAAVWMTVRAQQFRAAMPNWLLAATFLLMPFGIAFGTNNALLLGAMIPAPMWVGAAVVVGTASFTRESLGWIAFTSVFVLGALVPLFAFNQLLHEPLQLRGDQTERVESGRFAGLDVDADTKRFLAELEMVRLTLDDDPTVISLWRRPAVTFALGGHGIGFPWYSDTAVESAAATVEGSCVDQGPPTGQVVVVTEQSDPAKLGPLLGALASCDISFPDALEHVTTITSPDGTNLDVYVSN